LAMQRWVSGIPGPARLQLLSVVSHSRAFFIPSLISFRVNTGNLFVSEPHMHFERGFGPRNARGGGLPPSRRTFAGRIWPGMPENAWGSSECR
jgi:hypothetical protein